MSISSIGSTTTPIQSTTASDDTDQTKGTGKAGGGDAASTNQVATTVTETNADGSTTTITTYADGTTSTSTTPPVPKGGPGGIGGLLDGGNAGQGATLLAARAQSAQPTAS